jgi:hypothetical protein
VRLFVVTKAALDFVTGKPVVLVGYWRGPGRSSIDRTHRLILVNRRRNRLRAEKGRHAW